MTSLPRYLRLAVTDKVISLEQARQIQRVLNHPLPNSSAELEPEIQKVSLLLYLHQLDSRAMTKH